MTSSHLCEQCASEKGLEPGVGTGNVPLTDFLAQMGKANDAGRLGRAVPVLRPQAATTSRRPAAWAARTATSRSSRTCVALLRRIHGGTQHVGKVYLPPNPSVAQREERLAGLRRETEQAVESEDFERAAEIRDLIRSLEGAV